MSISVRRYSVEHLFAVVQRLFEIRGMEKDKASSVATSLVTADMLGHSTHGLGIAPWYLEELGSGGLRAAGEVRVISDRGACIAWDGQRFPGAWLIDQAIDMALNRVSDHGVVTCTIANGHHTGALATYLPRVTQRGLMAVIACSGPASQGVAPYGGLNGLFTPNPLAAGVPSHGDPVMLDISCSITTIKRSIQLAEAGERYPGQWAMDANGQPTDDPRVLLEQGGSLLPVGGLDHGHKGYGMALLVEALTQGLSGCGRRDVPSGTVMNTFIQILDPEAFGGRKAMLDETDWLVRACHANPPRPGVQQVRVPGDQALTRHREAIAQGVALSDVIVNALSAPMAAHGLDWPGPMRQ
ncbi:Ldh family oxidoreductase [Variovorax ureilyticus]|uniref:Ldh family oxidoreductase n=1 Tax=Variovorax ureilyticus TaxID=1836198 RepID=A0ABU8VM57_9BURK